MRKEGCFVFLVGLFVEATVDWIEARVLAFLACFIYNLFRKESRSGKRIFMSYNSCLLYTSGLRSSVIHSAVIWKK